VTDLRTDDFDYDLPPERIAQTPVEPRDASRLLVVHRDTGALEHRVFRDIVDYLRPGDLLVANDSRVLPGRLWARKATGGRVELLLLRDLEDGWWEALARPATRLRAGQRLELTAAPATADVDDLAGSRAHAAVASPRPSGVAGESVGEGTPVDVELGERTPSGGVRVRFSAPVHDVVGRFGYVPLPPYIHTPLADPERYQTVYARVAGSAAAPTAGLHFTPRLLETLAQRGVTFAFVTLHVGPDTFRPVKVEHVLDHEMHSEFTVVPDAAADAIAAAKREGRRVIAVGTTSVRTLESWPGHGGWSGWTRLFIYPGYTFKVVDAMITNFHLPRSTLLMLVSAFAGRELIGRAYAEAISRGYRFYSFGDASLIL
jgi:S-adenosylmethionine:tRNA ribosyltransferase-isomerase